VEWPDKFVADFKSTEKKFKNLQKVISKNVTEKCSFLLLFMLGAFFKNLFNGFEISMKVCVWFFETFSDFLKQILWSY
jgi:hypothetical protein